MSPELRFPLLRTLFLLLGGGLTGCGPRSTPAGAVSMSPHPFSEESRKPGKREDEAVVTCGLKQDGSELF